MAACIVIESSAAEAKPHTPASPLDSQSVRHLGPWTLVAVLLLCQLGLVIGGANRSLHGQTDFRAFYAAGKLVSTHHGAWLYSYEHQRAVEQQFVSHDPQTLPFLYPAFASLFFVPFAMLPYRAAFAAFSLLNVVLLALFVRWARHEIGARRDHARVLALLIGLGTLPVAIAFLQGQISLVLLMLFAAASTMLRNGKDERAGALLALSFAKFQLAIPLLVLFCCWRRWRLVRSMLTGGVILAALSVLVAGREGTVGYVHSMSHITASTAETPAAAKAMYGMFAGDMPNLHGICYFIHPAGHGATYISLVLSVLLMAWAARRERGFATALCVAMLVSYHLQAYDMTLLLAPLATAAGKLCGKLEKPAHLLLGAGVLLSVPVGAALVYSGHSALFLLATVLTLMSLEQVRSRERIVCP